MKALMNACVVLAMLAVPVAAFAETDTSQKAPAGMNCPMMETLVQCRKTWAR